MPRARPSHAGSVAASFGAAALCTAALPAAPETRLFVIVALGLVSALVGFSALRRRLTRMALLLALVGLAAPVIAITCVVLQTAQEPAAVTSSTAQRATLQPDSSAVVSTREFEGLSAGDRAEMKAFLSATAQQIQTMHGAWAPLPSALRISNGALVEGDGLFRGTVLGAVPPGVRLAYEVSSDGSAFRIAITSSTHPGARIWADRGLQVLTAGS